MNPTTSQPKPQPAIASADAPKDSPKTAKLFMNGRSQAVRLPKEFRFPGNEVTIRRDPATGEILLSVPPVSKQAPSRSMEEWFKRFDSLEIPDEIFERKVHPAPERDSF